VDGSNLQLDSEARRRRRSLRRTVNLETDVTSDEWEGSVSLLTTDLSQHGCWLESDLPLDVGTELAISFVPPGDADQTPVAARGRVVHVALMRRRSDAGRPGMGVSFHDVAPDQSERLSLVLNALPPRLPRRHQLR
jgi:hypothetical protein